MLNRRRIAEWVGTVCLAGVPLIASGGGMRLASQDAFATARGEAFAATADNASAVYYNPAGITQLEGLNVRAGIYGIHFDPAFTHPTSGETFDIRQKVAAVPQMFCTVALEDTPVTFGFGLYAPYGLGLEWPQDTGFRAVALESQLTYLRFNPVVAIQLPFRLSLAAGMMVDYSRIILEQGLRRNELPPPFVDSFRFEGDGWSLGYNLGLLWQPHEKFAIGATFRSRNDITYRGDTDVQLFPVIPEVYRSPARAGFSYPMTAVFGMSFRPTPRWNLEFNADITDWSSFDRTTIHQSNPNINVQPDPEIALNWASSWMYEFGVTRYLGDQWQLSVGYVFSENSIPDAHYTPLVPDMDRHFITVGAGYKGRRLTLDVAYQFGIAEPRWVTGSTPSTVAQIAGQNADGKYEFVSHAVLVTTGWHF